MTTRNGTREKKGAAMTKLGINKRAAIAALLGMLAIAWGFNANGAARTNLALNKTAVGSSYEGGTLEFARLAVDGDTTWGSRWGSD